MIRLAFSLLSRRRKAYITSMVILSLCSFLMLYQLTTFNRVMNNTSTLVSNMSDGDLWVMHPSIRSLDSGDPSPESWDADLEWNYIQKLKTLKGVESVSSLSTAKTTIELDNQHALECRLVGLQDPQFQGGPSKLRRGKLSHLLNDHSFIMDEATGKRLFKNLHQPFKLGRMVRVGGKEMMVVGFSSSAGSGQNIPTIYTTKPRAESLSTDPVTPFIIVKTAPKANIAKLKTQIEAITPYRALPRKDFAKVLLSNQLQDHHIPYYFSWAVLFSFLFTLAIIAATLSSAADQIQNDLCIFKTLGASKLTIYQFMLSVMGGTTALSFLIGIVVYFATYLALSSSGIIFIITPQALFLSGACMLLIAFMLAVGRASVVQEIQQEVS